MKKTDQVHKMVETQILVTQSEPQIKNSMIVVSNRLPFVLKKDPKTGELSRSARYVKITNARFFFVFLLALLCIFVEVELYEIYLGLLLENGIDRWQLLFNLYYHLFVYSQ